MEMYSLRLFHDFLDKDAKVQPIAAQHQILYVYRGKAVINGEVVEEDNAKYCIDMAVVEAAEETVIWRFQLLRTAAELDFAKGEGVKSELKIDREVKMFELTPRTEWLFRLDCIYDNKGSTGLHSHPGSGIRCLKSGELHVRGYIGENSDNVKPGDTWYEEGAYPIVSTSYDPETGNPDSEIRSEFLRGMIMPKEYAVCTSESPNWIEGCKSVESKWKGYSEQVVRLL